MMAQDHYNGPIIEEMHDSPRRVPFREVQQNTSTRAISKLEGYVSRLRVPGFMHDSDKIYELIEEMENDLEEEKMLRNERGGATQEREYAIGQISSMIRHCRNKVDELVRPYHDRESQSSQYFETGRRYNSQESQHLSFAEQSSRFEPRHKSRQLEEQSSDEDDEEEENNYSQQYRSRNSTSSLRVHRRDKPKMKIGRNTLSKNRFRKTKPGQKALRDIRHYQQTTNLLMQRAPFRRTCVEILGQEANVGNIRIRGEAIDVLHEAAECFLVETFESSALLSSHAKRKTLMDRDMRLYRRLCLKF